MLFPTLDFAIFFVVVFAIAWELRGRAEWRKAFLLGASYVFYGYWDWRFTLLLAASSLINYTAGRLIGLTGDVRQRKLLVATAVVVNLAILGFFKYYGFFMESLAELLARAGLERDLPFLEIILPIGISFFTFQGISYVVDVYRRAIKPADSPLDIFLYISFFPQLVAGPIVRAADFLPQLKVESRLNRPMMALGVVLILTGLFKKMVIANYLGTELVEPVFFDPGSHASADLILAVYGYAVQIYCDFSGYSDMAIGTAALLGYRFKWNFNQPYRAASLQEFWRRWHISLSEWLRDYLYKPLGGSRGTRFQTYRNLFLTMLLGGIWHGAAWTFVIWGVIHGAALIVERAIAGAASITAAKLAMAAPARGSLSAAATPKAREPSRWARAGGILVTFNIVCLAWIFFRAQNLPLAIAYIEGLGLNWSEPSQYLQPFLVLMVAGSLLAHFLPSDWVVAAARRLETSGALALGAVLGFGILLIEAIAPEGVAPFIYFQF